MSNSVQSTAMALTQGLQRDVAGGFAALHVALGHDLGLFRSLAENPASASELAQRLDLNGRITAEWATAMAESGYITSADDGTLSLDPAQTLTQADASSPFFFAGATKLLPGLASSYDDVMHTFRHGSGIARKGFSSHIWSGMWQMSGVWLNHMLLQSWIPQSGVGDRLASGGSAAHIFCGDGTALRILAGAFPNASFIGYDPLPEAIERANTKSEEAGLSNTTFHNANPSQTLQGPLDLVLALDTLHDTSDLTATLRRIDAALSPGGTFLCLESKTDCDPGPGRTMLAACSTFFSVPLEISQGGSQLGMLGLSEPILQEHAAAVGLEFSRLDDPTPLNALYLLRKAGQS